MMTHFSVQAANVYQTSFVGDQRAKHSHPIPIRHLSHSRGRPAGMLMIKPT